MLNFNMPKLYWFCNLESNFLYKSRLKCNSTRMCETNQCCAQKMCLDNTNKLLSYVRDKIVYPYENSEFLDF